MKSSSEHDVSAMAAEAMIVRPKRSDCIARLKKDFWIKDFNMRTLPEAGYAYLYSYSHWIKIVWIYYLIDGYLSIVVIAPAIYSNNFEFDGLGAAGYYIVHADIGVEHIAAAGLVVLCGDFAGH